MPKINICIYFESGLIWQNKQGGKMFRGMESSFKSFVQEFQKLAKLEDIPKEKIELMLRTVCRARNGLSEASIEVKKGKRVFSHWHCGKPMLQVLVFLRPKRRNPQSRFSAERKRLKDELICTNPGCLHHFSKETNIWDLFWNPYAWTFLLNDVLANPAGRFLFPCLFFQRRKIFLEPIF